MRKRNKKIKRFEKLLKKDEDWDYAYLLDLEERKLQFMLEYFKKSIIVDTTYIIRDISICLNLLKIIKEEDSISKNYYSNWEIDTIPIGVYINKQNSKRFNSNLNFEHFKNSCRFSNALLLHLRCDKAWHLYNLIRLYKMQQWWD